MTASGDDATFIILSQSLEHGRYHDEFLVGTPPHAKFPPGMPVWIAFLRQVAGPSLEFVRGANLLLLGLTGLLLGDAIRRMTGPWPGVAGVALTALSPPLLQLSGTAFSEVPYAFLATASVWTTIVADKAGRGRWTALALAAALASFLTRTAGLSVVGGVIAWMLLARRWKRAAWSLLISASVIGGWFWYTTSATKTGAASTYAGDLRNVASARPGRSSGLLGQAARNAREYVTALPPTFGLPAVPGTPADNLVWLLILGIPGTVGLLVLIRKWPAGAGHLLLSGGMLLVWPWAVERLLAPLIPIIAAAVLTGSVAIARSRGPKAQAFAPLALAVLVALSGLVTYLAHDTNHRCERRDPYADSRCFPPQDRGLVAAARMIRDSLPSGAVVATAKPATVFYFSGHPTIPVQAMFLTQRLDGVPGLGSNGAHTMLLSQVTSVERWVATRLLDGPCERLEVRAGAPSATLLLRERPSLGPGENACAALKQFLQAPRG